MPVVSSGDLTALRSEYQRDAVRISWLVPPVLWQARINDAVVVKGDTTIAFDAGTGSYFALVEAVQEVWVGSAAGLNDVGRLRIKSISSGDSGVTGTLVVGGHSHPLQDDLYLTFLHDYPLKPKFSYVEYVSPGNELYYMDDDVGYTNQHTQPTPVVVAGPHRASFLISGTETYNVDASDSYAIASGATISTYGLSVASIAGTPTVNFNTSTGTGDITFTVPGVYWAKYTVTDSNGKSQVSYRCYMLHDPDVGDASYPFIDCDSVQIEGDFETGGWTAAVKAEDNMALADIPDHTLCVIWHTPWYEGSINHISFLPDSNSAVFIGYVREDSGTQQMGEGFGEADLTLSTVEGRLRRMFAFSTSLIASKNTPTDWYEYEEWQTCGTIVHDLFLWRSTILEIADVIGLRDDTLNRIFQGFDEGNIYDNANNFLYNEGIRKRVVCDQGGRIHIVEDQQLMIDSDRSGLTTAMEFIQTAAIADYGSAFAIQRRPEFQAPFVTANGIYWDGNTWDDEDRPFTEDTEYCSIAPGGKPLYEGPDPQDFPKQTVASQDHLNKLCGRYEAKVNNPFVEVVIEFHGIYNTILDFAYGEQYLIDLQAAETPREIVWSNKPLYCRHVQAIFTAVKEGGGAWEVNASFEPENITTDGIYTECPSFPTLGGVIPPVIDTEDAVPGALITGASVNFKPAPGDLWTQRLAQNVEDLIEDSFWRTKTGSLAPSSAILFRCGSGYIKRTTDAFDAVDVDVTPSSDPPNDAGDSPAPTATGVTYFELDGSYPNQDEFIALARWQNATSEWRSWIAFTDDNGTTWSWKYLGGAAGGGGGLGAGIPIWGAANKIKADSDLTAPVGSTPLSAPQMIAVLSPTKVVLSHVGSGGSGYVIEACVGDISGDTVTTGNWYTLDINYDNAFNPKDSSLIEIDENTFLYSWIQYPGSSPHTIQSVAGNVSGTTIAVGTPSGPSPAFTSTNMKGCKSCKLSDTKAIVVASKNNGSGTAWVVTVVGNGSSYGTGSEFATIGEACIAATLSETSFVVFYKQLGDCYAKVGTVSGTTISFGSAYQVTVDLANLNSELAITALSDSLVIFGWEEIDSSPFNRYKRLRAGTVAGSVITLGTPVNLGTTSYSYYMNFQSLDKIGSETFICRYDISGVTNDNDVVIGTVSGTDITIRGPWAGNTYDDFAQVRYLGDGTAILYSADQTTLNTMFAEILSNLDGTAYVVDEERREAGDYNRQLSMIEMTSTRLLLAWTDDSNSLGVWLVERSGDTLTALDYFAALNQAPLYLNDTVLELTRMTDTYALVVFSNWVDYTPTPDEYYPAAFLIDITSDTISMPHHLKVSSDLSYDHMAAMPINSTQSWFLWTGSSPQPTPTTYSVKLSRIDRAAATISVGSTVTLWTESTAGELPWYPNMCQIELSALKFAVFYADMANSGYPSIRKVTSSGSSVSSAVALDSVAFEYGALDNNGRKTIAAVDAAEEIVVCVWQDTNGDIKACAVDMSGGTPSAGSVITVYDGSVNYGNTPSICILDASKVQISWGVPGISEWNTASVSISGTTLTNDNNPSLVATGTPQTSSMVPIDDTNFLLALSHDDDVGGDMTLYLLAYEAEAAAVDSRALGGQIGKSTGLTAWVTAHDGTDLTLIEVTLPALAIANRTTLGAASEANIDAKIYIAYPFVPYGYENAVYIYGRMDDPQSLGSPAHVIRTTDGGTSFGLIEDGWGLDHCGSLKLSTSNYMFAIRNSSGGSKLYRDGADNILVLRLTMPFPAPVAPHGMFLNYYTLDVYAIAWVANAYMVAKISSPYIAASNLTFDHAVTDGGVSIIQL